VKNLFLTRRFFYLFWGCVLLFLFSLILPWLLAVAIVCILVLAASTLIEIALLYAIKGVVAERILPEKFSNGNDNPVQILIENRYNFPVKLQIYEDYPVQFQIRDGGFDVSLGRNESKQLNYSLKPLKRGEYVFGYVNTLVTSSLGLVYRRFRTCKDQSVAVYPSFLQMRRFELMAVSNRLTEIGVKKIRKVGSSTEFEHIRPYVQGDDPRKVNWQATSRRGDLMVNNYQDERSQQVYCLIDKGRVMKMPFEGMSLLDYAINASLVLLNTAMIKGDKAGLITFSNQISNVVPAERRPTQMNKIMEVLYTQRTFYKESDYEILYATAKLKITQRSLLILFTNFETIEALNRQLFFLRKLASQHLLVVILFENTEMNELLESTPKTVEDIYIKTIAEKFRLDKRLLVRELEQYGIHSILTTPGNLTVSVINKYLELKSRGSV
jgi:uncharacterized protein (DUF58 family)